MHQRDVGPALALALDPSVALGLAVALILGCSPQTDIVGSPTSDRDAGAAARDVRQPEAAFVLPKALLGAQVEAGQVEAGRGVASVITSLRIEPADGVIAIQRGQTASTKFRAFAVMNGTDAGEVEITGRTVFYVPDKYLVGSFPSDGSATFSVRVPKSAAEPAQRGGIVHIQAQAANPGAVLITAKTTYTVKLIDSVVADPATGWATPAIPDPPDTLFAGTETASVAPRLVYPNDGVLLPPNLGCLEVHWMPGTTAGKLYEVSFTSNTGTFLHYVRCYSAPASFATGACTLEVKGASYEELAQSNRGSGPVTVQVRASDQAGRIGTSKSLTIEFANDRVDGAVYYWAASAPPRVMRFDFGSQQGLSSVIEPANLPLDRSGASLSDNCVGCHALSRDGQHLAVSKGGGSKGWMVYIKDLAAPRTTGSTWLTLDGKAGSLAQTNPFIFATFDPTGSTFAAVAPIMDITSKLTEILFYDGATGLRKTGPGGRLDVGFNVTFPDWSPDGTMLAVTRAYGSTSSFQRHSFEEAGISILNHSATGFALPAIDIVPRATGKNRYNAVFTPDSNFLLYSESVAPGKTAAADMDGYSDPVAKSWAVAPKAGATPILLARSTAPGIADGLAVPDGRSAAMNKFLADGKLMDTFPRPTPFAATRNGHRLFWFTLSSQRRAGLRRFFPNNSAASIPIPTQTLLWMFALDADELAAGRDGSFPGFFLPFQDLTSSNHMASWTQKYVSQDPPQAPPLPPDPAPPAAPPPPPLL